MTKNNGNKTQDKNSLSKKAERLRSLSAGDKYKAPQDNGRRLVAIPRGDSEELRLVWSSYDGHPYLNISLWKKDGYGVFRPLGAKTMSVRISELRDFAEAVEQALELAEEELSRRRDEE